MELQILCVHERLEPDVVGAITPEDARDVASYHFTLTPPGQLQVAAVRLAELHDQAANQLIPGRGRRLKPSRIDGQ